MTIRPNWGLGIALVYAAFAAGTLTMVAIASSARVELVSDDYYERSLLVDGQMAAADRGRLAKMRVELRQTDGGAELALQWPAEDADARGTITLYRPSMAAADRAFAIAIDAAHQQHVPLAGLARGRWNVQVRWMSGGREYYVERALNVP